MEKAELGAILETNVKNTVNHMWVNSITHMIACLKQYEAGSFDMNPLIKKSYGDLAASVRNKLGEEAYINMIEKDIDFEGIAAEVFKGAI